MSVGLLADPLWIVSLSLFTSQNGLLFSRLSLSPAAVSLFFRITATLVTKQYYPAKTG